MIIDQQLILSTTVLNTRFNPQLSVCVTDGIKVILFYFILLLSMSPTFITSIVGRSSLTRVKLQPSTPIQFLFFDLAEVFFVSGSENQSIDQSVNQYCDVTGPQVSGTTCDSVPR